MQLGDRRHRCLSALWLLLALPAAGATPSCCSAAGRRTWGPYLAIATCAAAFVYALVCFFAAARPGGEDRVVDLHLFTWIPVGGLPGRRRAAARPAVGGRSRCSSPASASLIHVYSLGYMEHDPRRWLFFAYLNLFVAAMLLLVLGNSFLALYVGWEGVGLASYLLISFWYYKPGARHRGEEGVHHEPRR